MASKLNTSKSLAENEVIGPLALGLEMQLDASFYAGFSFVSRLSKEGGVIISLNVNSMRRSILFSTEESILMDFLTQGRMSLEKYHEFADINMAEN